LEKRLERRSKDLVLTGKTALKINKWKLSYSEQQKEPVRETD